MPAGTSGGRVFLTSAVTSGPTASVITASAAAGVKLPSGLSAAASSAGGATSPPSPAPAADQQAGLPAAMAAGQWNTVSAVSPISAGKLPLFFQLLLQRFEDVVNPSKVLPQTSHGVEHHLETRGPPIASPSAGWTRKSWRRQKRSLQLSSGTGSSGGRAALGPLPSTW